MNSLSTLAGGHPWFTCKLLNFDSEFCQIYTHLRDVDEGDFAMYMNIVVDMDAVVY